jgi:hypothetical protein
MHPSVLSTPPAGPTPAGNLTKRSLTRPRQQLLALLQHVRYGRIHRLPVRGGEPDPRGVRWTRTVKVLGENAAHPSGAAADFHLRREVVEFFRLLSDVGDGEITDLEVRNGLPFLFEVSGTSPE